MVKHSPLDTPTAVPDDTGTMDGRCFSVSADTDILRAVLRWGTASRIKNERLSYSMARRHGTRVVIGDKGEAIMNTKVPRRMSTFSASKQKFRASGNRHNGQKRVNLRILHWNCNPLPPAVVLAPAFMSAFIEICVGREAGSSGLDGEREVAHHGGRPACLLTGNRKLRNLVATR
jgi:hypothetical protein